MAPVVAFIYAHPDDESFASACLIRSLADRGIRTVLLSATRGDAGRPGPLGPMTPEQLSAAREIELQTACDLLGVSAVKHLGLPDGKLAALDRAVLAEAAAEFLNETGASVVVTFPADGISGHPDHIAVHHAVNEAVLGGRCPHVQKLYYNLPFAGVKADEPSVLRLETAPCWKIKARALLAHRSQQFSVEKAFGPSAALLENKEFPYENFRLVWLRGEINPLRKEESVLDDLM
ncbi:PIG-L deacetylase family protein [Paenibacillus sp. UNC499MF]|uniref:PIG-L deacetylase family protein n=1 Tax=Paenibacillus sp. UNC499MF TaxID=1502751 RepID=UPI0008A06B9E|nr:PIG-L family deacetylase [Paenibacillus sp. UNC499MF]SEF64321.1 N-acetylglucosaminyl deacetylase, LmbE family [Paenibacillus sp. UNC499MF]